MKRSTRQLAWQWVLMGALLMGGGVTSAWAQNTFPASGDVGIGTTGPSAKLQIVAGTAIANAQQGLNISDLTTTTIGLGLASANNSSQPTLFANTSLAFQTNGNERMRIDSSGNVGIGTTTPTTKLHVAGDVQVDGNLAAKYQDVAEWVQASSPLPPGTVVIIDPQRHNQILMTSQPYDTRVAGAVSARPGLLLGEAGPGKVKVAQSGRVTVKVDASYGPIAAGDLLVTSATLGHAMRSTPINLGVAMIHRPGTLLGKALEPLEEGQGEILVLLTLQ